MFSPSGFMVYFEDLDALSDLSDTQLGAVMRGLAAAAQGNTPPAFDDQGERIAFRLMLGKVNRDIASYRNRCTTNRANRARRQTSTIVDDGARSLTIVDCGVRSSSLVNDPAVTVSANADPTATPAVVEAADEGGSDGDAQPPADGEGGSVGEPDAVRQQQEAVFDATQRAGFPMTAADMAKATALMADYTPAWVLEAVRRASGGTREQRCWRYVGGILRRWRKMGGIDSENRPETARPVTRSGTPRLVTAQQYTQRQYTTEELDKLFDDLTAEELGG